ncbi:hypothetical protein PM082_021231 [Marasmius tenuissimus]|nr:hypothetical protein PM082_021231 [Marasmius tenuissimus]
MEPLNNGRYRRGVIMRITVGIELVRRRIALHCALDTYQSRRDCHGTQRSITKKVKDVTRLGLCGDAPERENWKCSCSRPWTNHSYGPAMTTRTTRVAALATIILGQQRQPLQLLINASRTQSSTVTTTLSTVIMCEGHEDLDAASGIVREREESLATAVITMQERTCKLYNSEQRHPDEQSLARTLSSLVLHRWPCSFWLEYTYSIDLLTDFPVKSNNVQ